MDGIDTATLPLLHGSMVYYVDAYTNFVQVEVVDNYSNVNPLNITVLEHDVPLSPLSLFQAMFLKRMKRPTSSCKSVRLPAMESSTS